tara:strand:+ start:181 stop:381 length:201 start_codon:yes stop_codon:yes gene_type:complete
MSIKRHLGDHNLTYFGHMKVALWFAGTFTKVVLAALCHGIIPSIYKTYCSDKVKEVYKILTKNKDE